MKKYRLRWTDRIVEICRPLPLQFPNLPQWFKPGDLIVERDGRFIAISTKDSVPRWTYYLAKLMRS